MATARARVRAPGALDLTSAGLLRPARTFLFAREVAGGLRFERLADARFERDGPLVGGVELERVARMGPGVRRLAVRQQLAGHPQVLGKFLAGHALRLGGQALVLQGQLAKRLADRPLRRVVAAQHLDRLGSLAAGERRAGGGHDVVARSVVIGTARARRRPSGCCRRRSAASAASSAVDVEDAAVGCAQVENRRAPFDLAAARQRSTCALR